MYINIMSETTLPQVQLNRLRRFKMAADVRTLVFHISRRFSNTLLNYVNQKDVIQNLYNRYT